MLTRLYKRILEKLQLTPEELFKLQERLTKQNICKGPFLQGEKMCPNTTALAIKGGDGNSLNAQEVKMLLKKHGVTAYDLCSFYLLFDLPSMFSDKLFEKSLGRLKEAVDELLNKR